MNYVYTAILSAIIGAGLYGYFRPVQTRTEYKDRTVVQNQIRTVVRTVERPDGSKEIVQETTDNSTAAKDTSLTKVESQQNNWLLGVQFGLPVRGFEQANTLRVERHIFGPLFAGGFAKTNGEVGISLSWEL